MLNNNKKLHSFGHEAQNNYYNLEPKETTKFYHFEHFKMALHNEKVILYCLKLESYANNQKTAFTGIPSQTNATKL